VNPTDAADAAHDWLDRFAELVRARDTATAEAMFAPGCSAFGTRAAHMTARDQLVAEQWTPIWTTTEGFRFLDEGRHTMASADGSQVTVAARWVSEGVAADGTRYPRAGRATLVLEATAGPDGTTQLVARHSHFSELPGGTDPA
jgi:ketosteroid isomerase-like protein